MPSQTESARLWQYISPPFTVTITVACARCGQPAGTVDTTDIADAMLWIKQGRVCTACADRSGE